MPDPLDPTTFDAATPAADDFYQHVNATWLTANPVPPMYPAWGSFQVLNVQNQERLHVLVQDAAASPGPEGSAERMVGDYFASGMDEAAIAAGGTAPLQPLLDRIDGLADAADLPALLVDLQMANVGAVHSTGIAPDFADADAYLLYLGQGGLGLPERDYYVRDDERSVGLREAYRAHVATQLGNLGASDADATAAADGILALERRLAEASLPADQLRDPTKTLNRFDIDDLDGIMPSFGLTAYVRAIGVTLPSVSIDHPPFFQALDEVLAETPIGILRAYLRFHLVRAYASALPAAFDDANFGFYGRTLGGQQEQQERWKRVLDAMTREIGEQVAQLFVRDAFPPEAKARCEALVDHLLSAMGRAIRANDWMSEPTREEALTKLAGFGRKIGYPGRWRDYTGLEVDRTSFVGNRLRAALFESQRQLGRLADPVDREEWAMPAHVVNAYYHPLLNEIVFPAGILQPPFFHADADDAVNYGGIGMVIGHEITHGFDDSGSRFDATGALRDWWAAEDRERFEVRAEVLVDQFEASFIADDAHVNGRLTLGENIADLGGVTIALDAMHEAIGHDGAAIDGLMPEQRFFASYATVWRANLTDEYARLLVNADPHAPTRFRVNVPLSNLPAFAAAFDVPEGAPMARPAGERARIW